MICINCGKEIEDGAKFCNYCGKRTDGKVPCPSCGKLLPADSLFCSSCGKSLSAVPVEKEVAVTDAATETAAVSQPVGWKKIVTFVSWGCVAFAALMGLIFTFCIGVSAKIAGVGTTVTVYDYFGKVYEELGNYEGVSATEWVSLYLPNIFGTLISAGAIISAVVFSIMATAASVKRFIRKKEDVNFERPVSGLYISFAVFATAFLALQSTAVSYSGVKVGVNFSEATLAGLILGGIGLGGYFVCKTLLRIADFKDGKVVVKSSVMLGVGVVSVIAVSLLVLPVIGMRSGNEENAFGFISLFELLYYGTNTNEIAVICCSIAGFAVQVLLLVFTVKVVLASAEYVSNGEGGKILPYAITDVVLSAVYLAFAITVGKLYLDGTGYGESYKLGFGAPIAALVLNVVVLVGVIVAVNLFRPNRAAQATEELQQPEEVQEEIQ